MKTKIGLLFAGQGAQTVGMGKDIAESWTEAAEIFQRADLILGHKLSQVMFDGPVEELTKTSNAQPALYVHGLACLEVLKKLAPNFDFVVSAGLSLGEFTAHAAAGTFTFEDGLRLVDERARAMQDACEQTQGGMLAVIGIEEAQARELAAAADLDVANINCPGQIVLSGESSKISIAAGMAKDYGARKTVELTVAGAFHSRLMEPAYQRLKSALSKTIINAPRVPVVCNVDAIAVKEPEEIRRSLAEQVTGSVRWAESIELMMEKFGCELFVELGPGGVLAGFINRIRKGFPVLTAGNAATLADAATEIAKLQ
ncbi:MAG: ACP S-malonyltransferase [Chthoniobacterales bacterium]|nr:ACP S-malonyltransferase [Chthoniobacterales bacterium]